MKIYTYKLKYNSLETGKMFYNITEAKKEQTRLVGLGLWGYTVCKINK
jgi:hypothetical protein